MLRHFEGILNMSDLRKGCKAWCIISGKQLTVTTTIMTQDSIHILSRCLAHVINLAMQALLAAHSVTKHYDPSKLTDHEPNVNGLFRDEIGLVRAITVKVSLLN